MLHSTKESASGNGLEEGSDATAKAKEGKGGRTSHPAQVATSKRRSAIVAVGTVSGSVAAMYSGIVSASTTLGG